MDETTGSDTIEINLEEAARTLFVRECVNYFTTHGFDPNHPNPLFFKTTALLLDIMDSSRNKISTVEHNQPVHFIGGLIEREATFVDDPNYKGPTLDLNFGTVSIRNIPPLALKITPIGGAKVNIQESLDGNTWTTTHTTATEMGEFTGWFGVDFLSDPGVFRFRALYDGEPNHYAPCVSNVVQLTVN
jgi:hypothetical protein